MHDSGARAAVERGYNVLAFPEFRDFAQNSSPNPLGRVVGIAYKLFPNGVGNGFNRGTPTADVESNATANDMHINNIIMRIDLDQLTLPNLTAHLLMASGVSS